MKILSKLWDNFLTIFGLKRNSKYVKNYLNEANMKSGIFMSFVIFVLEVWLVIRQADKYVIPKISGGMNWFEAIFKYTSLYFVMMFFGAAMFMYSMQYISNRKSKSKMIVPIVFAALSIALCCLLPLEFKYKSITLNASLDAVTIQGILKLFFYAAVFAFDVGIIFSSIYRYRGGKRASLSSVMVISLFALVCLAFGVMVSYGDFISSTVYKDVVVGVDPKTGENIVKDVIANDKSNKQIICFLMFTIYIGCLLIWNPLISIGILGTLFLAFFFLLNHVASLGKRIVTEGDQVNYITFFISLAMVAVSIYNQRLSEAKKDEELEELATKDKLTGLMSFEYFVLQVQERIERYNIQRSDSVYLFVNITNFKVYNDQKGFEQGNEFLKTIGQILSEVFNIYSLICRQSDDHFVIFARNENIAEKIELVNSRIEAQEPDIKPGIRVGAYEVYNPLDDPHYAVEKARYAYAELKRRNSGKRILYYDDKMHDDYLMVQYIVTHIDEAIKEGYVKAYYQPVVWSKGRSLCGAEALARWIDPKYGFLSPAKFVPALESAQLIYKLDKEVLRLVCQDIRYNLDNGLPALPVSINFSRADFGLIDIVEVVTSTANQYNVPHELLHIEITESALTDEEDALKETIIRLHEKGFATWLDDFGSGYSSFNVLKDYEFDVLKLDMKFLTGFDGNMKSRSLIRSVIAMADQIGMKTLCEGVETMEQAAFLEEAMCGRLQGYLYGKPLSYQEIMNKIKNGEYELSDDILIKKKR
ncbi:MAG: EAL domain-containing protein [Bacilli bacterium]|nr:EAL domain-containing protein [Bacilli bacterium]